MPRGRPQLAPRQDRQRTTARGDARGRPARHVDMEARLQLAERRDARIRVLIRHAPTGRPLDRRIRALSARRSLAVCQQWPPKSVDLPALSRVSFNHSLTPRKGRKEGTWGRHWRRVPRHRTSPCPATAAGACRSPTSKAASSSCYFYPRADTPGCTREAIAFSGLRERFKRAGADILGISADPVKAQDAFKKKHELTSPWPPTTSTGMLKAYGVWGKKSMYGRTFMGIIRSTFLIGPDGRIAQVWAQGQGRGPRRGGPGSGQGSVEGYRSQPGGS